MSSGIVFDIRKFAVHDGPGIRTAVFLKGCPLRCLWCHNPEGLSPEPELLRRRERCVSSLSRGSCGACARACPETRGEGPSRYEEGPSRYEEGPSRYGEGPSRYGEGPSRYGEGPSRYGEGPSRYEEGPRARRARFDPRAGAGSAECARCATLRAGEEPPCAAACPAEAFQLVGERREAEELMEALRADRVFYRESGGGVTFTGGEPLTQGPFLLELLESCRAEGIGTAVDTSGWAPRELLLEVADIADLLLFDLKLVDEARHRAATGVPSGPILSNLEALARTRARLRIRVPLLPGVNDGEDDLSQAARLSSRLSAEAGGGWAVDILPYHDSARGKYRMRGESYAMGDTLPPSEAEIRRAALAFEREGLDVSIGGTK